MRAARHPGLHARARANGGHGLAALLGGVLAIAPLACRKAEAPAAGRSVPFADDFERAELGPDWRVSGGQWWIDHGAVFSPGANNAPLFLEVNLPADVVVEVDVKSETDAVDSKIELMTDGFRHQSGYIFILGGWSNRLSVIARLDEHGDDRKVRQPTGATSGRWYHWRISKRGGELTWLIDGQPYLAFHDPQPLDGPGHNRLAFSNWQNQVRYDNLRIWAYAEAPPVRTSSAAGGAAAP